MVLHLIDCRNFPSKKLPANADIPKASLAHWPTQSQQNLSHFQFSLAFNILRLLVDEETREKICKAFNSFMSPVPRPQKSQLVKSFRSVFFKNSPHPKLLRCLCVLFIFSKYWIQFAVKSFVSIKFACRSSRTCLSRLSSTEANRLLYFNSFCDRRVENELCAYQ